MHNLGDRQFWPTDQINDGGWWHMPVIPALQKQRQEDSQLEAGLNYGMIVMLI